jgi:hypothetical protein
VLAHLLVLIRRQLHQAEADARRASAYRILDPRAGHRLADAHRQRVHVLLVFFGVHF